MRARRMLQTCYEGPLFTRLCRLAEVLKMLPLVGALQSQYGRAKGSGTGHHLPDCSADTGLMA